MVVFTSKFLAIAPQISMDNGCLVLSSPLLVRMLSLGIYQRTVTVDTNARQFTVERKLLGQAKRTMIPFEDVRRIDYRFVETGFNTSSAWFGSDDTEECFTVTLILKESMEEIILARFLGEGSVDHGWKGILAGDDLIDLRGDQEEQSLAFVQLLQAMTGIPLT